MELQKFSLPTLMIFFFPVLVFDLRASYLPGRETKLKRTNIACSRTFVEPRTKMVMMAMTTTIMRQEIPEYCQGDQQDREGERKGY
jgi:hypothetical protein